ncbi:MAG: hypothetical protein HWN81_02745 [Candidatus Lokiarchaeota archaeon]|nr:hypothetical protein [Candidatus Lokiarchaeota archaeon]
MVPISSPKIYNYLDGNGNQYIIKNKVIEYMPVKPLHSSSGVYNGGHYTKKELSKQQYNQLTSILNEAIKNKKSHIKNRVKMSGLIVIQEENKEKAYILNPGSEEISKIENSLKNIMSN